MIETTDQQKCRRRIQFCIFTGCFAFKSFFTSVYGALEVLPVGGRALGMGSAYVSVAKGPESVFFNPAGLFLSDRAAVSLFISHPYGLKELMYEAISSVLPTSCGNLGFSLQTFGHTLYRENTFAIGWGKGYKNRIGCGVLVRAAQIQIQRYGSETSILMDAGCLIRLNKNLTWGMAFANLNGRTLGRQKESLPQIIRIGLSGIPIQGFLLSVEIDKDERFAPELKGGCEIRPLSTLSLRWGFGRDPSFFSLGIGLSWGIFTCDYGFTSHPVLGATHQSSITIQFKSSKDKSSSRL